VRERYSLHSCSASLAELIYVDAAHPPAVNTVCMLPFDTVTLSITANVCLELGSGLKYGKDKFKGAGRRVVAGLLKDTKSAGFRVQLFHNAV
jgi:hypothetical protein